MSKILFIHMHSLLLSPPHEANASKFVQRGFILLRCSIVDSVVEISVADSGPGIPLEKRGRVFEQYQASLDSLQQGKKDKNKTRLLLDESLSNFSGQGRVLD